MSEVEDIKTVIKPGTVVYVPIKIWKVGITSDDRLNILYSLESVPLSSGSFSINRNDLMDVVMKGPVPMTTGEEKGKRGV